MHWILSDSGVAVPDKLFLEKFGTLLDGKDDGQRQQILRSEELDNAALDEGPLVENADARHNDQTVCHVIMVLEHRVLFFLPTVITLR